MTARTERIVLAVAAVVLLAGGFLLCHLLGTTSDAERAAWEARVDSLLGEQRALHRAEVATIMARADSAAVRARLAADRARAAEAGRAGADRAADSLRAITDSIDDELARATTAADSVVELVAKVGNLQRERDRARQQVQEERVTAADWRNAYLEEAKRTGELLARIAKDSVRIVKLEVELEDRPKGDRWSIELLGFRVSLCGQYSVARAGNASVGPTVCKS